MPRPRTILLAAALLTGAGGVAIAQQGATPDATPNDTQQHSGSAERSSVAPPGSARSLNNSNPASGPALLGGIGTPPAAAPGSPRTASPASAPQP